MRIVYVLRTKMVSFSSINNCDVKRRSGYVQVICVTVSEDHISDLMACESAPFIA